MIKEYCKFMAKEYKYTANWKPYEGIKVGDWTKLETGFRPWLDKVALDSEIIDDLKSVMRGSLDTIMTTKSKLPPMCLSHKVSIDAGISGGPVKISATKEGGFFAIFQDIQQISAKPSSFQEKIRELDEEYVAIISSVTKVSKGLLVIFSESKASFTLPAEFNFSLDKMHHELNSINLNFDISIAYSDAGVSVFQAEPGRELIPFVVIERVKPHEVRDLRRGRNPEPKMSYSLAPQSVVKRAPRSVKPTEKYDIQPFSYTDFFETMEL